MTSFMDAGTRSKSLTPSLSDLAAQGTVLANLHSPSPVCTPSRFALMTGQYPSRATNDDFRATTRRNGGQTVVRFNTHLEPGDDNLARRLKQAGYVTGAVGKNHFIEVEDHQKLPYESDLDDPGVQQILAENAERLSEAYHGVGFEETASLYFGNPDADGIKPLAVHNQDWVTEGARFFPQNLQEAGYQTGFFGKWHMGRASDEPRPGFGRWVSFRGQGSYYNPTLNIDGERSQYEGYTAELLTDYALDWIEKKKETGEPFFAYLSHKNVHAMFKPAPQDSGRYKFEEPNYPSTMPKDAEARETWPDWVKQQRSSWHGVDYMYHGQLNFDDFYQRYTETVLGIDRSIERVLNYLEENGLAENTLVIYMGDNGFSFGEHGLIDKRHAFEESMRVPMLAWGPGFVEEGARIERMVQNTDIAPTVLELAGTSMPEGHVVDGRSMVPLLQGQNVADWRESVLYEYYWEWNFPQTPTQFALRGDRYKYIYYYGVWDDGGFYDLQQDPEETNNLIDEEAYQDRIEQMRTALFDKLEATGGMQIPLRRPQGGRRDERRPPGEASTDPLVDAGADAKNDE